MVGICQTTMLKEKRLKFQVLLRMFKCKRVSRCRLTTAALGKRHTVYNPKLHEPLRRYGRQIEVFNPVMR